MRRRKVECGQFKCWIPFAREEIRLILHPIKHEAAGALIAKLDDAGQAQALDIPAYGLFKLDDLGQAPQITDEIEHNDLCLSWANSQPASQLLHEDTAAVRDAHKDDHIDIGDVHTLVEKVACGNDVERAPYGNSTSPDRARGVSCRR